MNPPERNGGFDRQTRLITHLQPLRLITMGGHLKLPHVFKLLRDEESGKDYEFTACYKSYQENTTAESSRIKLYTSKLEQA
jgi:hypothetical protein